MACPGPLDSLNDGVSGSVPSAVSRHDIYHQRIRHRYNANNRVGSLVLLAGDQRKQNLGRCDRIHPETRISAANPRFDVSLGIHLMGDVKHMQGRQ